MTQTIDRYFLDINSINNLNFKSKPSDKYSLNKESKNKFDFNKFFYKQIGKKHQWTDRLIWQDKNWIDYVSNENVETYILQTKNDLIGYFELIFEGNNCELAYLGILEEYIGKGLRIFLSEALNNWTSKKQKSLGSHLFIRSSKCNSKLQITRHENI